MKTDSTINGVTVKSDNTPGCWCEQNMKKVNPLDTKYKTCFLNPVVKGKRFNASVLTKCVFKNKDKLMTIEEIYAIGPAISIMMEGYVEGKDIVSLRGTLVPATTINRSISSIPLLGDLLVGKKVGEGVFGVSFKIKGPPKDLKTRVNPIKTLTPRFITRTLEKIKKN